MIALNKDEIYGSFEIRRLNEDTLAFTAECENHTFLPFCFADPGDYCKSLCHECPEKRESFKRWAATHLNRAQTIEELQVQLTKTLNNLDTHGVRISESKTQRVCRVSQLAICSPQKTFETAEEFLNALTSILPIEDKAKLNALHISKLYSLVSGLKVENAELPTKSNVLTICRQEIQKEVRHALYGPQLAKILQLFCRSPMFKRELERCGVFLDNTNSEASSSDCQSMDTGY